VSIAVGGPRSSRRWRRATARTPPRPFHCATRCAVHPSISDGNVDTTINAESEISYVLCIFTFRSTHGQCEINLQRIEKRDQICCIAHDRTAANAGQLHRRTRCIGDEFVCRREPIVRHWPICRLDDDYRSSPLSIFVESNSDDRMSPQRVLLVVVVVVVVRRVRLIDKL
jgi:hypothetical protein